jgi:hypothetical protein
MALAFSWIAAAACGEDPPAAPLPSTSAADDDGGTATGEDDGAGPTDGADEADSSGGATDDGPAATDGGDMGPTEPADLPALATLVVLGDSIGDGGGVAPYYHDLLYADLQARYGDVVYDNRAEAGSETDALLGQVEALPAALPGPVAVVVTSGGADMRAAISAILGGSDGPARMQTQANIEAALEALLAPDRFGAGVEVYVFEANLYDASDGVGDYAEHGCAFGQGLPAIPTDAYFANWNGTIANAVGAAGQRTIDVHADFDGHGYAARETWYDTDCILPNATGHDALRRLFYEWITGEALP